MSKNGKINFLYNYGYNLSMLLDLEESILDSLYSAKKLEIESLREIYSKSL